MLHSQPSSRRLALLSVLGAASLVGSDASACGGLFCSSTAPVNQAAERIIFAFDDAAHRTTAVVEILYEGPSESFAWMLPVPGTPELGVSTGDMLNQLQQATNPTYQLQRSWAGSSCSEGGRNASPQAGGVAVDSPDDTGAEGGVSVLDAGIVGPYDYRVLGVPADFSGDPAEVALDWLSTEGFDVSATAPDILRPYFEAGMNLAAIRLTKQATTGSIRPIRISYDSDHPMIPIRPTGLAANDDMGVLVWLLGQSRAVPTNYKSLELNEALIDWFNPQQTYNDVVIAAANEAASGQGFVTELARPILDPNNGQRLGDQVFNHRFAIDDFRRSADELDDADLVVWLVERFSTFGGMNFGGPFVAVEADGRVALDGVADVLAATLTLPDGVSVDDVLGSPSCYVGAAGNGDFYCNGQVAPEETIDLTDFDRFAFLTAVEEQVFSPMEETAALFAQSDYVTRFYTTLSAEEMTVDPEFDLNPDLPDVDNLHQLEIVYEGCPGDASGPWEADVGGRLVRGEGTAWPLTLAERAEDMPVNLRILQLSTIGDGEVDTDNSALVSQLLETQFGGGSASGNPGSEPIVIRNDGGCSLGGASAPGRRAPAWLALAGLAAAVVARRRRR